MPIESLIALLKPRAFRPRYRYSDGGAVIHIVRTSKGERRCRVPLIRAELIDRNKYGPADIRRGAYPPRCLST